MTTRDDLLSEALKLHEANRLAEADIIYASITSEHPRWAPGLWNRGRLMHALGYQQKPALVEAAKLYSATLKADGDDCGLKAEAFCNLGTILLLWGHIKEAKECWGRCLALRPDHPHAGVNLGIAHRVDGELNEAIERQSLALLKDPNCPEAHFENAFIALTLGDLVYGFSEYEWRWKCDNFTSKELPVKKPKWNGEKCDRLLLMHEQGLGDSIMFIRYAKMAKERSGAHVKFVGPPELTRLFRAVEGIDEVANFSEPGFNLDSDSFDYYCQILSLPRIFKTDLGNIPSEPYIDLNLPTVTRSLPRRKRIGIAWAGRKEHGGDRWRSTKLEQWTPLFELSGIEWHCLQPDAAARGYDLIAEAMLTHDLKDFSDTAQLIAGLDLVICVDTAVAHLAGAMGKPVWILLPFSPDWRWMLEREDSPWYPTARLFRQPARGDWDSVFQRVKSGLQKG